MTDHPADLFNYAKAIVDRFAAGDRGGASVLADLIGEKRTTVGYWVSAATIPDRYRQRIIDAGARVGVLVTPFCFVAHLRARELSNAA